MKLLLGVIVSFSVVIYACLAARIRQEDCACSHHVHLVCARVSGQLVEFGNDCLAHCAGADLVNDGPCHIASQLPVFPDKLDVAAVKSKKTSEPVLCNCQAEYSPVCDVHGVTHSSRCQAQCSGAQVAYEGFCVLVAAPAQHASPVCSCPMIHDIVCGSDGQTYSSPCNAECAGVSVVHQGECERVCPCSHIYDPVCGLDGIRYANPCVALCFGATVTSDDACAVTKTERVKKTAVCACPTDYNPVCGTDLVTYPNACSAECSADTSTVLSGYLPGTCESRNCRCTREYKPICNRLHVKFLNRCVAIDCMQQNAEDLRECDG